MATCAICMEPITAGKFRLVDTEVVHAACARLGLQTRQQRADSNLAAVKSGLETKRRELLDMAAKLRAADRAIENGYQQLQAHANQLSADKLVLELTLRSRDETIAALRRELAERAQQPPAAQAEQAQPAAAPVDDASVRFSLLEL